MSVKHRWIELKKQIAHHDTLYYQQSQPVISDAAYDALRRELLALEKEHPDLAVLPSISQNVGGGVAADKVPVPHTEPMLSLDNVFDREGVETFLERVRRFLQWPDNEVLPIGVEPKIDGVSAAIRYVDGSFSQGLTRGNGQQGEDVSAMLATVANLPLHIPFQKNTEVRGEVYMPRSVFQHLNDSGECTLVNPRNAASGRLRQKEPDERRDLLRIFFYHWCSSPYEAQSTSLDKLHDAGFPVNPHRRVCRSIEEIQSFYHELQDKRDELDYDIDGVVMKVDSFSLQGRLGTSSRAPRYAMAYKFPASHISTKLLDVEWQVGRTGHITPVAHFEPVLLGGATIRRATLHNIDFIKEKDLGVGDWVSLERAGDVIPKIVGKTGDDPHKRPLHIPQHCPSCGTSLVREEDSAFLCCPSLWTCHEQIVGRLIHSFSRDALDLSGLGGRHVRTFVERGWLSTPPDIFQLAERSRQSHSPLETWDGWGDRSAQLIWDAIEKRRHVALDRWIYALGLPHVGRRTAQQLAGIYQNADHWMETFQHAASIPLEEACEDLCHHDGWGVKMVRDVLTFFVQEPFQNMLHQWRQEIQITPYVAQRTGALSGQTFVLTGTLSTMGRAEAKQAIEKRGGRVASSLTAKTDGLIVGDKPGSKLKKAQELHIPIVDEATFLTWLDA